MTRHRSLRSELYRDARILGDIDAISKGPTAYAKRYVRRRTYAHVNGLTSSILRSISLSK